MFASQVKTALTTQDDVQAGVSLLANSIAGELGAGYRVGVTRGKLGDGDQAPVTVIDIKSLPPADGDTESSVYPGISPPIFDPDTGEPIWPWEKEDPDDPDTPIEPWPRKPTRKPTFIPNGPEGIGDLHVVINDDGTIEVWLWTCDYYNNCEWVLITQPLDPAPGNYPHPDPPPNNEPLPDGTYPWDDPKYDPYA
jgi:hypothetical protein